MRYRNPAATADIIVERENKILLVKRKHSPFRGKWAIPGGFLECNKETLEQTAARELKEETGLNVKLKDLKLFGVYSSPDRDPRGHVISHVYYAENYRKRARAGDDAKEIYWFSLGNLPELAFDHKKILKEYLAWRRNRK